MAGDAVATVRAFLAAVAADEHDAVAAHLDPDVTWYGTRGGLDQDRVTRGPDAVLAYLAEIGDPWEHLEVHIEELVPVADDTVVALLHEVARTSRDGVRVDNRTAMIIRVRDARVVEATGYLDRDEALRAART